MRLMQGWTTYQGADECRQWTSNVTCGATRATSIPVDEMLELQDAAGIELAVVMPPLQDPPDDGWLAERIKGQPRLLGCALINPLMGVEAVANLERSINDFGFRGMKLMPAFYHYHIESEVVDPVMSKAAELRVPVTIHSGSSFCLPAQIGLLAGRHPDVTVIMDHMGYRDYVGAGDRGG